MDLRRYSRLLYQIKIANQELTAQFEKQTGFSLTRYEIMMFLKETGRCSQTKIQFELCVDSAAVTRQLKILEENGYVKRERNKENNREIFVEITEKAREGLEQCEKKYGSSHPPLAETLSKEEEETLGKLLQKLIKQKEV